jgi:hypothetical protein
MRYAASLVLCAMVCAAPITAQSLGDLARKEDARRKAVTPGKVYTNGDLPAAPAPSAPVATEGQPSGPSSTAAASDAGKSDAAKADGKSDGKGDAKGDAVKKDEAYWRGRLQAERDAIERAKVLLDALQSRINSLQTDFVNRDDPAARATIAAERQRALGELDRTKLEIQQRTKVIAQIQDEARQSGAPAGWYR